MGGGAGSGIRQSDFEAYSLKDYLTIASPEAGMLFYFRGEFEEKEGGCIFGCS